MAHADKASNVGPVARHHPYPACRLARHGLGSNGPRPAPIHAPVVFDYKGDYEPVIADVAASLAVKYSVDEWRLKPDCRVYGSPLDAPDFDLFTWPQSPGTMFFVFPDNAELPFRHRQERQVPEKYGFYLLDSDEALSFRGVKFYPSGFYKSEQVGEGLLEGWLATNSGHPDSLAIFNAFKKSIKKRFEYFRFSGVYVGPEAVKYFESGGRLNQDLRMPPEGDAKRVDPRQKDS